MSLASTLIDITMGDNSFESWKAQMELNKKKLMAQYGIRPEDINETNPNAVTYADVYKKIADITLKKQDEHNAELALKGFDVDSKESLTEQAKDMYATAQEKEKKKKEEIATLKDLFLSAQKSYRINRTSANKEKVGLALGAIEASPYAKEVLGGYESLTKSMVGKSSEYSIEEAIGTGDLFKLAAPPKKLSAGNIKDAKTNKLRSFFQELKNTNPEVYDQFKGLDIDETRTKFSLLQKYAKGQLNEYVAEDLYDVAGVMLPKAEITKRRIEEAITPAVAALDFQITNKGYITPTDITSVATSQNLDSKEIQALRSKFKSQLAVGEKKRHSEMVHTVALANMSRVSVNVENIFSALNIKGKQSPEAQVNFFIKDFPQTISEDSKIYTDKNLFKNSEDDELVVGNSTALESYKKYFKSDTYLRAYYNNKHGKDGDEGFAAGILPAFIMKLQRNGNTITKQFASSLQAAIDSYVPPEKVVTPPYRGNPEDIRKRIKQVEDEDKKSTEDLIKLKKLKEDQDYNIKMLNALKALQKNDISAGIKLKK